MSTVEIWLIGAIPLLCLALIAVAGFSADWRQVNDSINHEKKRERARDALWSLLGIPAALLWPISLVILLGYLARKAFHGILHMIEDARPDPPPPKITYPDLTPEQRNLVDQIRSEEAERRPSLAEIQRQDEWPEYVVPAMRMREIKRREEREINCKHPNGTYEEVRAFNGRRVRIFTHCPDCGVQQNRRPG